VVVSIIHPIRDCESTIFIISTTTASASLGNICDDDNGDSLATLDDLLLHSMMMILINDSLATLDDKITNNVIS